MTVDLYCPAAFTRLDFPVTKAPLSPPPFPPFPPPARLSQRGGLRRAGASGRAIGAAPPDHRAGVRPRPDRRVRTRTGRPTGGRGWKAVGPPAGCARRAEGLRRRRGPRKGFPPCFRRRSVLPPPARPIAPSRSRALAGSAALAAPKITGRLPCHHARVPPRKTNSLSCREALPRVDRARSAGRLRAPRRHARAPPRESKEGAV